MILQIKWKEHCTNSINKRRNNDTLFSVIIRSHLHLHNAKMAGVDAVFLFHLFCTERSHSTLLEMWAVGLQNEVEIAIYLDYQGNILSHWWEVCAQGHVLMFKKRYVMYAWNKCSSSVYWTNTFYFSFWIVSNLHLLKFSLFDKFCLLSRKH